MKRSITILKTDFPLRKFRPLKTPPPNCKHPIPAARQSLLHNDKGTVLRQKIAGSNFLVEQYTADLTKPAKSRLRFDKRKTVFIYALEGPLYGKYRGDMQEGVIPGKCYAGFCTDTAEVTVSQCHGISSLLYLWVRHRYLQDLCKEYPHIKPICDFLKRQETGAFQLPFCPIIPPIIKVISRLKNCYQKGNKLRLVIKGCLVELLEIYQQQLDELPKQPALCSSEEKILNVLEYLRQHYLEKDAGNPTTLCKRFYMERSTLSRDFKKMFRKSIQGILTDMRMNHAENRIFTDGLTIKAAALEVGYSDEFAFSKAFTRNKGYPPSEAGQHT